MHHLQAGSDGQQVHAWTGASISAADCVWCTDSSDLGHFGPSEIWT